MMSVIGRAQDVNDSIMSNPLDTIASYDIFDKLSETAEGRVMLGGDDVKSIVNELKTQKSKTLKGWRIRIFRDSNQAASRRAESIRNDIKKTYPRLPVYVTHNSPNFFVEVGDYRTRDDAEKMRRTLIASFPAASLVSVSINFPPL
ncbi:MAG: SPOR domain-containing protein [Prevotellaceae bacterium]|nr:SPOR domain-containing protein [Prevotellaceae bacterium]